ncbi:MAG: peptidylprolyl isomerase [Actinomycetales bacterium]|nr:peptidylprolyl isomerase [Actinomycetales bacterium]
MASSKREREAARRRYAKYQEARAARDKVRRRQRTVGLVVVGALVLTLGVTATVLLNQPETTPQSQVTPSPTPTEPAVEPTNSELVPSPDLAENRTWTGSLTTNQGEIGIELDGAAAPQAVANFVTLAADGFFDDTQCHRLVTSGIYILQCGDPDATGTGGPGYDWGPVENAPSDSVYPAGTIAMARVGNDQYSMGSQFFLVYEDSPIPSDSAGGYTVFGQITSGLDVVQAIADEGNGADGVAPASEVIIEGVQVQ